VLTASGSLVQEVRAAEVADEHEVAGEEVARVVGERAVGDQEGEVLGGVPGGVSRLHDDVAQGDGVAMVEPFGFEAVLPVVTALSRNVSGGPGRGCQFTGAGEIVGVDVGLGHGNDPHAVTSGQVEIWGQVTAGIDDDRLALCLATDEIAGLGQVLVVDALEKHASSWTQWVEYTPGGMAFPVIVAIPLGVYVN